jgi:ABC-2 type transport system ATP-binding protein
MSGTAGIVVDGLRKRYGATLALDGMSFAVRPGLVTGFVGPNGAGKSTTMRVILGLDAAEAGTALIEGKPYHRLRHPLSHVGSLLDAAALLGDPPALLLDEPFNGMDPDGIIWMRGFLRSLAAQGRAVLVSSHLMSELQHTAGRLVVAGRGRAIADASVTDLIAAASGNRVATLEEAYLELTRDAAEFRAEGPQ